MHLIGVFPLENQPTHSVCWGNISPPHPLTSYATSASAPANQFSVRHSNELPPGYSPPTHQESGEAVTLKSCGSSQHLTLSDNTCLEQVAVNKRARDISPA